jgi:hypothetical protein
MNIYYMNEKLGDNTIIAKNTQPSEYQDLVDDYLAKGGKITYCEEGARATNDVLPDYEVKIWDEYENRSVFVGLFDQIEAGTLPIDPDKYFDPKERV